MNPPSDRIGDLLGCVPILAGVGESLSARLASRSEWAGRRAGQMLFEEGDPGDSLDLVLSGRLEALSAAGEVIRTPGHGDSAGELRPLLGLPRSATAHAPALAQAP